MADAAVIISISVMFGTIFFAIGRDVYARLVKPFLCYKLVVFDSDDEFTFYVKKKKAIVREGVKGFRLFSKKGDEGELYLLPLDQAYQDVNDKFSKRDDRGFVTYYYYRNNTSPINIMPDRPISMVLNDARASNKLLNSNIFDAATSMDVPPQTKLSWMMIGIVVIVVFLIIVFQDKIRAAIGG